MSEHQPRISRETAEQRALFLWACVFFCYVFIQCRDTHISAVLSLWATVYGKRMYRCVLRSSKGIGPVRLTRKLIWPHFALFNPFVSFSEFDRRNKQVNRKKPGWGGAEEYMNVWSFLVKLLTALWVYSPVKWFGILCVFLFSLKCPHKDRKLRQIP